MGGDGGEGEKGKEALLLLIVTGGGGGDRAGYGSEVVVGVRGSRRAGSSGGGVSPDGVSVGRFWIKPASLPDTIRKRRHVVTDVIPCHLM